MNVYTLRRVENRIIGYTYDVLNADGEVVFSSIHRERARAWVRRHGRLSETVP